ncbi:MAG: hypothetical protein LKE43_00925 [Olsenella sp.]|nr:hypothetical protein [Olsenella sp.]
MRLGLGLGEKAECLLGQRARPRRKAESRKNLPHLGVAAVVMRVPVRAATVPVRAATARSSLPSRGRQSGS